MTYQVLLSRQAAKSYQNLVAPDQGQVKSRLIKLKSQFDVKSVKIQGEQDVFRTRVGKYRILYLVDTKKSIVVVLKIDKWSRVYKR